MTGEKDPRDVMQAEHDAGLSEHPAFRAPAEMPGEEEIARAMCKAQHYDPDFDYDPNGISDPPGTNVRWKLYIGQARAILALFAPFLAEKERLAQVANDAREAHAKCTAALIDQAEARALAAEAALAAERERVEQLHATIRKAHVAMTMACALPGVAAEYDFSEAIASTEATLARRAAAIRAQGE